MLIDFQPLEYPSFGLMGGKYHRCFYITNRKRKNLPEGCPWCATREATDEEDPPPIPTKFRRRAIGGQPEVTPAIPGNGASSEIFDGERPVKVISLKMARNLKVIERTTSAAEDDQRVTNSL